MALEQMATARLGKDVVDLEDVTYGCPVERAGPCCATSRGGWRRGSGSASSASTARARPRCCGCSWATSGPTSGRVKRGETVRTAMLTQEVRELDEVNDLRVQEAVEKVRGSVRIGDRDVTAGQMLENLGFARERVWTPVRELSGGERRRLQLLRLLMGEPNVLALDEPTNDLDTDTLAAVEDALDGWPGTLLVVSHDRYLLERICDRQVALLGDGADPRPARRRRGVPGAAPRGARAPGRPSPPSSATQPQSGHSAGDARAARKELARLERQLSRLAAQEEKLHARMAEQATDHEAVLALDAELRQLHDERARLEEEWLRGRRDRRLTRGSPPY